MTVEDKEAQKRKIIEELFHSKVVHGIAWKQAIQRNIDTDTGIQEDVIGAAFETLLKMKADKIIELYNEGGRHLNNYIGTIISTTGYNQNKKSPNTSVSSRILFASTLKNNLSISPTEEAGEDGEDANDTLRIALIADEQYEPGKYEAIWNKLKDKLEPNEFEFLQMYVKMQMVQRRNKKVVSLFNRLKYKIQCIVEDVPMTRYQNIKYKYEFTEEEKEKLTVRVPHKLKGKLKGKRVKRKDVENVNINLENNLENISSEKQLVSGDTVKLIA